MSRRTGPMSSLATTVGHGTAFQVDYVPRVAHEGDTPSQLVLCRGSIDCEVSDEPARGDVPLGAVAEGE